MRLRFKTKKIAEWLSQNFNKKFTLYKFIFMNFENKLIQLIDDKWPTINFGRYFTGFKACLTRLLSFGRRIFVFEKSKYKRANKLVSKVFTKEVYFACFASHGAILFDK